MSAFLSGLRSYY